MTRWWIYAILAIAVLTSSFAKADASPFTPCTALHASTTPSKSTACQHSGPPHQGARRDASGTEPLAIVPASIDVSRPTAWTIAQFVVAQRRRDARVVVACSRGPPPSS